MKEKELIKQLNNLSQIRPSAEWRQQERNFLLAKLENSAPVQHGRWQEIVEVFYNLVLRQLAQPALVFVLLFIMIASGGVMGYKMSQYSKPGDSLYIAKRLSERTRYMLAFDEKTRTKLNLEFASKRVEEITKVLAEEKSEEHKQEQVKKLASEFKQTIKEAKTRVRKTVRRPADSSSQSTPPAPSQSETMPAEEESQVFSANLSKDARGISTSEQTQALQEDKAVVSPTSTPQKAETKKAETILEEAEKLFEAKEYDATLNKLEEAAQAIEEESTVTSSVVGHSDTASTSEAED